MHAKNKNPLFPVLPLSLSLFSFFSVILCLTRADIIHTVPSEKEGERETDREREKDRDRERERAKERERKRECVRVRTIETLLHDVLWLIEATFNLHCSTGSPRLWYGEREREGEKEKERE